MLIPTFFCFWLEFEPERARFFCRFPQEDLALHRYGSNVIEPFGAENGVPDGRKCPVLLSAGWCEVELPRRNENGFQPSG